MSAPVKALKWSTIGIFLLTKQVAIPLIGSLLVALFVAIGVFLGYLPHAMNDIQSGKDGVAQLYGPAPTPTH